MHDASVLSLPEQGGLFYAHCSHSTSRGYSASSARVRYSRTQRPGNVRPDVFVFPELVGQPFSAPTGVWNTNACAIGVFSGIMPEINTPYPAGTPPLERVLCLTLCGPKVPADILQEYVSVSTKKRLRGLLTTRCAWQTQGLSDSLPAESSAPQSRDTSRWYYED